MQRLGAAKRPQMGTSHTRRQLLERRRLVRRVVFMPARAAQPSEHEDLCGFALSRKCLFHPRSSWCMQGIAVSFIVLTSVRSFFSMHFW